MCISDVTSKFIAYYTDKGAELLESASLVHPLFPMSFNMSAGLVQLDSMLRMRGSIPNKKMVVIQKCFRHFDMVKVSDFSHLSFFEMGGYFQVGEFDTKVAMTDMHSLLTMIYKIDPSKLWVTTFAGGEIGDAYFEAETELHNLWSRLLDSKERVISFGQKNNFWVQGGDTEIAEDAKLCGPQLEIFYDLTGIACDLSERCLPNCKCARFLEISNNLFITHKITTDSQVLPLPNHAIESVIGIERVCAVQEGKVKVTEITDIYKLKETLGLAPNTKSDRIIDHMKALCFLIADGAPDPGRNGRARIVRTLMREMLSDMHVYKLDIELCLKMMMIEIIEVYGDRYPTLPEKSEQILNKILTHNKVFEITIAKSMRAITQYLKVKKQKYLSQNDMNYFHKKYGVTAQLIGN